MNRQYIHFYWRFKVLLIFLILCWAGKQQGYAQYYPIHATVQWPSPQSPYLSDYYSGSRDRLIVNLLNRDLQQPLLFARLRIKIKSTGFLATSREEINYPMLELSANVPTRLTNIDLSPYLQPQNLQINGRLRNGQLPTGYTEFSVQVVDYYTGRTLSDWHTGRSYLDVKKPPILNFPEKDAQIGVTEPLYLRFQWMPRHQGLAGTEYEFVLKELPDNGAAPQSAFAYGNEIYRVRTRNTTLNYTHLEPILFPNRCYAWQVQAIARDGIDEVGMFENGGYSEINWFYLNDNCQAPTGLRTLPRFAKLELSWNKVIGTTGYVVECRPKTKLNVYEWSSTRVAGEYLTLVQLKPGWTYEWRVGTLCTDDRPVFSDVHEFTLSSRNDELLADCGKESVREDLSQKPNLRIKAGDIVTIGGDYPMTITEAVSLGDGWYSGRGKTRLKTIIDAPVALRFDRLRINLDNFQIDGTVEASYDEKKAKIANLDYVDDGGKDIKPADDPYA
ncbi:fibronectin type III domain-containing protein [Hoylesella timonensis]|uniref:fibronectin type III domain-containing protein n=1 Tax=Hoylesella timonensis TaxID=386414 RepID=UPI003369F0B4